MWSIYLCVLVYTDTKIHMQIKGRNTNAKRVSSDGSILHCAVVHSRPLLEDSRLSTLLAKLMTETNAQKEQKTERKYKTQSAPRSNKANFPFKLQQNLLWLRCYSVTTTPNKSGQILYSILYIYNDCKQQAKNGADDPLLSRRVDSFIMRT